MRTLNSGRRNLNLATNLTTSLSLHILHTGRADVKTTSCLMSRADKVVNRHGKRLLVSKSMSFWDMLAARVIDEVGGAPKGSEYKT